MVEAHADIPLVCIIISEMRSSSNVAVESMEDKDDCFSWHALFLMPVGLQPDLAAIFVHLEINEANFIELVVTLRIWTPILF